MNGFHAIILGPDTTVYVDPFARGDLTNYITYYKQDIAPRDGRLCLVGGDTQRGLLVFNALPISQGTTLRTYDLALASDRRVHGGGGWRHEGGRTGSHDHDDESRQRYL